MVPSPVVAGTHGVESLAAHVSPRKVRRLNHPRGESTLTRNREVSKALSVERRQERRRKYTQAAKPIDWDVLSRELRSNGRKRVTR